MQDLNASALLTIGFWGGGGVGALSDSRPMSPLAQGMERLPPEQRSQVRILRGHSDILAGLRPVCLPCLNKIAGAPEGSFEPRPPAWVRSLTRCLSLLRTTLVVEPLPGVKASLCPSKIPCTQKASRLLRWIGASCPDGRWKGAQLNVGHGARQPATDRGLEGQACGRLHVAGGTYYLRLWRLSRSGHWELAAGQPGTGSARRINGVATARSRDLGHSQSP